MSGERPINLAQFEEAARQRLDRLAYDYFRSGAHDERTLAANEEAFARIELLPRVLVDVSSRSLDVEALGTRLSMPVAIAPTAFHMLADPEGERATARGAAAAGVPITVSTLSTVPLEEVGAASEGPKWFQLYVFRDRGLTAELVSRAEAAGYGALILTVDTPMFGVREADVINRFQLPEGMSVASIPEGSVRVAQEGRSGLSTFGDLLDPSLTWDDLGWLVQKTSLPVAVKGVHRADDAERAAEAGAAAVIVSNHGARQLDTVPAAIEMVEPVAAAVGDRVEVLMDGGVRRGTDVIKALALGARAVLIGRPVLWALAAEGEEGVGRMLDLLRAEVDLALALCGCSSPAGVTRDLVR